MIDADSAALLVAGLVVVFLCAVSGFAWVDKKGGDRERGD